jgi:hypothetical protein
LLDSARRDQWPAGKIDFEHREKLNSFRKLCQDRMVAYWSDAGTLTTRCQLALSGLFRRHPQSGWVSGDQAVSPQLASELARLSSENADLRSQLAKFQQQGAADKELDAAVGRLVEPFRILMQRAANRYPNSDYTEMLQNPAVSQMLSNSSLFDLIMSSPEDFLDGSADADSNKLRDYLRMKMRLITTTPPPSSSDTTVHEAIVQGELLTKWVRRLLQVVPLMMRSWGLFESFLVDRPQKPPEKWLRLSSLGRRAFDEALGQFLDRTDAAQSEVGLETLS